MINYLKVLKSWQVLLFLLIFLSGIFYIVTPLIFKQPAKEYTVTLTEEGFSPRELTINKGDTVKFTTSRNVQYWPASNLHPTHEIYPEFDPQEPIESNKSWSFTFNKAGVWKYHDHLGPLYTGIIVVQGR
jgi:plastocyanin